MHMLQLGVAAGDLGMGKRGEAAAACVCATCSVHALLRRQRYVQKRLAPGLWGASHRWALSTPAHDVIPLQMKRSSEGGIQGLTLSRPGS